VKKFEDDKSCNECSNDRNGGRNDLKNSVALQSVPWLESTWGFYAIPANFPLSTSLCFRSGRLYGMDVSSGAGVAVLLTNYHDRITTDSIDSDGHKKEGTNESETHGLPGNQNDKIVQNSGEVRVLDLCCSPGLKLLQVADFFHQKTRIHSNREDRRTVKVVGVDVSKHRLDVCKTIVNKYFIDFETSGCTKRSEESPDTVNVQLYHEDGTTFGSKSTNGRNLIFDSRVAIEDMLQRGGKRKRMNKSARAREQKRLRQIASLECGASTKETGDAPNEADNNDDSHSTDFRNGMDPFDYVLVDAECSTDGSFKHIKERIKESSGGHHREENTLLTDPKKLAELVDLQRNLIASGFRLLKDGGTLVYSTCSLSEDQNENVVRWLLETHADAFLIPVHFPPIQKTEFVTDGSLAGTVRFYPNLLHDADLPTALWGDGFFVAKLGKRAKK